MPSTPTLLSRLRPGSGHGLRFSGIRRFFPDFRTNRKPRAFVAALSALDVAEYILSKTGPIPAMKLQKLVYYSQAWHIVWEGKTLFTERIEAWASGPIVPELYAAHRGQFIVSSILYGDAEETQSQSPQLRPRPRPHRKETQLNKDAKESVEAVLTSYGPLRAAQLARLVHREGPWLNARGDALPGEDCDAIIPVEALMEYYSAFDF